ncbi:hypothetical protein QTH91_22085 [Variovorax dokdonensis]|uniref:DUF7939 domain-containing protein n=1 Tax=Variovorax dokdonensis TaxID=344883 RepID=A0ABT7NGZ9_9BURK|nr:hypothetical protein [Variovorax dokdonensis]MDM0047198.1 hypothetical protein [Variovorax dokdonensis]
MIRTARAVWQLLVFVVLCLSGVARAETAPNVRVEVLSKQPVIVGQQVGIRVTVATPNFFTSAPPFPTLSVDGAIITMPDDRGAHGVEQQAGQTIATIAKTYVFVARRAGDFDLPQVDIDFSYRADNGEARQAKLQLPATRITARLPEGARAGDAVLPSAAIQIRQRLDRDASGLQAGDALVRTVQVDAANTQAMLIPPPEFEAPEGVRVFEADPQLSDHDGRDSGFVGGRRIDKVTYVFEKPGHYTLPAVELNWFDPATRKSASTQAPVIEVDVKAAKAEQGIAPDLQLDAASLRHRVAWWRVAAWAAVIVLVVLALMLAWRSRKRWAAWRAAQRQARLVSDAHMFEQALAACRRGDAPATHAALMAWSRRHAQTSPQGWAHDLNDPALAARLDELQRALYAARDAQPPWTGGAALASALSAAHRQWRHRHASRGGRRWWGANPHGLQQLNPVSKR